MGDSMAENNLPDADENPAKRFKILGEPLKMSDNNGSPEKLDLNPSETFTELKDLPYWMDKTKFLEKLINSNKFVTINAPSRFFKSSNMSMVQKFLEIEVNKEGIPISLESNFHQVSENYKLFQNTEIFQKETFFTQHFNRYPVIHISMKDVVISSEDEFRKTFYLHVVREAFNEHKYLIKSPHLGNEVKNYIKEYAEEVEVPSDFEVTIPLKLLSECLWKHFSSYIKKINRVYVLIDEVDAPVTKALLNASEMFPNALNEMGQIFSALLKGNKYVERALVTGIGNFLCYYLSNMTFRTFSHKAYNEFYGFTSIEVSKLLKKYQSEDVDGSIKDFYNGYSVDNEVGVDVYNGWSVLNYLARERVLGRYWTVEQEPFVMKAFRLKEIADILLDLLQDGRYVSYYYEKLSPEQVERLHSLIKHGKNTKLIQYEKSLFMQLMLELGILAVAETIKKKDEVVLKIPNKENKLLICRMMGTNFCKNRFGMTAEAVENFQKATRSFLEEPNDSNKDEFKSTVRYLFHDDREDKSNEAEICQRIAVALLVLEDDIFVGRERSRDRCDFMIFMGGCSNGMIIEVTCGYTVKKTPDSALINEKKICTCIRKVLIEDAINYASPFSRITSYLGTGS